LLTFCPIYDALSQVRNEFGGNVISQYDYVNDAIGRRTQIARSGTAMSESHADDCRYNERSELVAVSKAGEANSSAMKYGYAYDDIGNRLLSAEPGADDAQLVMTEYRANSLNQYTAVSNFDARCELRIPQYDADGNQTLVRTSTGTWSVQYNGENRPVLWTCGDTNITMKFDRMGRRVEYLETVDNATNTHHRFVYDGYLCIQRLNAAASNAIDLIFAWDPAEPVATRPLMIEKPNVCKLHVTHDGNKNVSDLVFFSGVSNVAAHYEYAPFGALTASTRNSTSTAYDFRTYNPFRFSSEYADDALGLVYYNYRHYEPVMGRWMSRDPIEEIEVVAACLYLMAENRPADRNDLLGLKQIGAPISCGNCLICLDNDSGSGDGNAYKIHWNCGRHGRKATSCRGQGRSQYSGSARLPRWEPSHGVLEVPEFIKDCVIKQTYWIEKAAKIAVPQENSKCCKVVEYKVYKPTFRLTPIYYGYNQQWNFTTMAVTTCSSMMAISVIVLLLPIGM